MRDEFDFIHKFLTRIENEWDTSGSNSPADPTVIVNNKVFWGQDRLEYALEEINNN